MSLLDDLRTERTYRHLRDTAEAHRDQGHDVLFFAVDATSIFCICYTCHPNLRTLPLGSRQ